MLEHSRRVYGTSESLKEGAHTWQERLAGTPPHQLHYELLQPYFALHHTFAVDLSTHS
jgi:hypothetical protein